MATLKWQENGGCKLLRRRERQQGELTQWRLERGKNSRLQKWSIISNNEERSGRMRDENRSKVIRG